MHLQMCICEFIPRLSLRTRVSLVVHAKELKRTTNTGSLAIKSLLNSEMIIRGQTTDAVDLSHLIKSDFQNFLFYPADGAIELDEKLVRNTSKPIHLIVPDGNWRQASKVHYRHHELKNVLRIKISSPNVNQHHLRKENTPEGMATLEAIAKAIEIIEGSVAAMPLLRLYQSKLEKTLIGRGNL